MSAIATPPALTPEDLFLMPDEGKGFELVHGELREVNVSRESSRVAGRICTRLDNYCEARDAGYVFPEGTSYRCFPDDPKGTRRADTSFISIERLPPETYEDQGHSTTVPDLVAEVVSPNDLSEEVEEKPDEWLEAGVKIVWVVSPATRTVRVHRADGSTSLLRAADLLTAEEVLPGFSCTVGELFRLPGTSK